MIEFVSSMTDNQMLATTLVCMLLIGFAIRLGTGSLLLGLFAFEMLNIWNLTIYATAWLGLGLKPFIPLWITLILLIIPPVVLVGYRMLLYTSTEPSQQ